MRGPFLLACAASWVAFAALASGCGRAEHDGDTPPEVRGAGGGSASGGATCEGPSGAFAVSIQDEGAGPPGSRATVIYGEVFSTNSARPGEIRYDTKRELGGCRLLVPAVPTDSPCPSVFVEVGTVSLSGLGAAIVMAPESVVLEPSMVIYLGPELPVPPPCQEGDPLHLDGDGFGIDTTCIAPLVPTGTFPLRVRSGEALPLTWEASDAPNTSRVRLTLVLATWSRPTARVECEVPDNGAFEIPEPLVTALFELGVEAYPQIRLTRFAVGFAPSLPGLSLGMDSLARRYLDPGIPTCSSDGDCPSGQRCDVASYLCEPAK